MKLIKITFFTVLGFAFLLSSSWYLSENLVGRKPSSTFKAKTSTNFQLEELRQAVKEDPKDLKVRRELILNLRKELTKSKDPRHFQEIIDTYQGIVDSFPAQEVTPEIEQLGDLYFARKDFKGAIELYKSVLLIKPDSQGVKGRLASAYTFLGQFELALNELDSLIKENPKSFQAHAYKAIAYAQMGKIEEAKLVGVEALSLAPSKEAKERLSSFLNKLDQSAKPGEGDDIDFFLKTHEVTATKFDHSSIEGEVLKLYFHDFPVSAMPPFVREKFYQRLKNTVKDRKELRSIELIDSQAGSVMDKIELFEQLKANK